MLGGGRGRHTRGACGSPDSVFSLCMVSCSESVCNPEFDCCHLSVPLRVCVSLTALRIIRAADIQTGRFKCAIELGVFLFLSLLGVIKQP